MGEHTGFAAPDLVMISVRRTVFLVIDEEPEGRLRWRIVVVASGAKKRRKRHAIFDGREQ
jgi:hypothetical protein